MASGTGILNSIERAFYVDWVLPNFSFNAASHTIVKKTTIVVSQSFSALRLENKACVGGFCWHHTNKNEIKLNDSPCFSGASIT